MPTPTIWVLNTIITLPSNLIYNDIYGNPVLQLYPWDYLVLVGQNVNTLKGQYVTLSSTVASQGLAITNLQAITSGITAPYVTPQINGQCLNGSILEPINTLLTKQITAWCALINVLGSDSALSTAIAYECPSLNSSPSFATHGTSMSSITGWISNPLTVADSLQNLWLTVCDSRSGIENLLDAVTPTCSQVIVDFLGFVPSYSTGINLYFNGYSFIPSGFTDAGSAIQITDSANHIYTTSIDLVAQSTDVSPFNIAIFGSPLLPTSSYTVTLTSNLQNTALGLTCKKTMIQTIINNITSCPIFNVTPAQTSFTYSLQPIITSGIIYELDLLNASGSTLQTVSYTNPTSIVIGSFTGLTANTAYQFRITATITGTTPITCPIISTKTTT